MQKKILILVIPLGLVIIVLLLGVLIFLGIPVYPFTQQYCGCHHRVPNYFFLVFGILLILGDVPISYYMSSKHMERKLDEHMDFLSQITSQENEKEDLDEGEKASILKFLYINERKVIEKLIQDEDTVLQSHISKMENMTKVKAHRAVKSLKQKGIVKTRPHGRTKEIYLNEEFKKLLPDAL